MAAATNLRKVLLLGLTAAALVAAGPTPGRWGRSVPLPSFTCDRPMPAPGHGHVTLAGLAYGPYHAGQDPNFFISPSAPEVAADMPTLAAVTNYIRIYSSLGPAADILRAAQTAHLCVSLGIWLSRKAKANSAQVAAGIKLARRFAAVRSVIVGNEVLLRNDMPVARLLGYIREVRAALGHRVAISYADDFHQWLAHPELARAVDFVTVHIYPFWQHLPIGSALGALRADYGVVARRFAGKPVVIGETGWPSGGTRQRQAVPSPANQARYFRGFVTWANRNHVPYFYFDAFDEGWKTGEHGVGTHWGLYDQSGRRKPALARWLPAASPRTIAERAFRDLFVGSRLETPFSLGIDTSGHRRHWLTSTPGLLTMAYPARQQWGAMFVTVGKPVPPRHRPSIDLSHYRSLSVQLRASTNGERVRIGIKDRSQPDNGGEITVEETLTTRWSTIALPLSLFANVDSRHLYVVFELVFDGFAPETVQLRNLRYSPARVPVPTFPPAAMPFQVYADGFDPGNHYVPSGYMGDVHAVTMNQAWTRDPHDGKTCIKVTYQDAAGTLGWAGVYWQNPVDNWGTVPGPTGYDLRRARELTFWVRGRTGSEQIQFLVGGITRKHGDSLRPAVRTPWLTLSRSWQLVTIPLAGRNLTHIIGGFGWVASVASDPGGATFYLDDITYRAGISGQWATKAPMPTARAESAYGSINGRLYVAGGEDGTKPLAVLEVYDPRTNTWTAKAPMPAAINAPASAVINGRLYVAGGAALNDPVHPGPFRTLYSYDPATNTWTTLASMPTPEAGAAAANVNGKLYVAGGVSKFVTNNPRNALLQVYDPVTNTWAVKASMPTARAFAAAVAINGRLYVVGGTTNNTSSGYTGALEVYDPATGRWSSKAPMPTPRQIFAANVVDGQIFAIGGDPGGGAAQTSANEVYDPNTSAWATATPMPAARYGMASSVIGAAIYIVGGAEGFGNGVPQTVNEAFSAARA